MKLKLALSAVCVAGLLSACGSESPKTEIDSPEAESPAVAALNEAKRLTAGWEMLDSVDYELPSKGTEHFSGEQVAIVAGDVLSLMQRQLRYQSAGSKDEVLDDADAFISEAPGMLSDGLNEVEKNVSSGDSSPYWPMTFVQPIDSSYVVQDPVKSAYAWDIKEERMHGTDGLKVMLFHRTFYEVQDAKNEENFLMVARWLELGTIDPEYAAASGDYALNLNFSAPGATVCDAVKHNLLAPSPKDDSELKDLNRSMKIPPGDFKPASYVQQKEGQLRADEGKCQP